VKIAKENKAKAIPLKVSGAWHSELMKDAVSEFRQFLEKIPFSKPSSKIIFNATAKEEEDPRLIRNIMATQLINPVRWYESMIRMLDQGVDTFVEVGPKNVLAGLMKKIVPKDSSVRIFNVEDPEGVERLIKAI
jgi:[acyl-carrier-protein] S-malonyltransferase